MSDFYCGNCGNDEHGGTCENPLPLHMSRLDNAVRMNTTEPARTQVLSNMEKVTVTEPTVDELGEILRVTGWVRESHTFDWTFDVHVAAQALLKDYILTPRTNKD
jgi:hypothetical protein